MSCSGVFQTGFQPRLLLFGSCLLCYCLPHPVVLCLTPLSRQLVAPSARQPVTLSVQPLVMFSVWWLVTFTTRQPATPLVWQSLAPGVDKPVTFVVSLAPLLYLCGLLFIYYTGPELLRQQMLPLPRFSPSSFSRRFFLSLPLLSHPASTPRSFPFFRLPPSTSSDHPYLRIPSHPPPPPLGKN